MIPSVNKIRFLKWFFLFFFPISCASCYHSTTYEYESIKSEYSHYICNLPGDADSESGDAACDLNFELTLEDAILMAVRNNPDMASAKAGVSKSAAAVSGAESPFYPRIGFYTEYVRGDAPSTYLFKKIDQRKFPSMVDFNDPGEIENFESGIEAGINLYNGGRDVLSKNMAEAGLNVSQFNRKQIQNRLIADVIDAYYGCLAAADFIEIAKESISTVQAELDVMQVKYKAGGALKSDILSLEVRLARAREDALRSENRLRMSKTNMANILGVNPDGELTMKKTTIDQIDIPGGYAEGLEAGLSRRPERKIVRERMRQARMALETAQSGYLPRLDLQAKYYLDDSNAGYEFDRDNWMAALVLNWDLFTGYSTKAEIAKAENELKDVFAGDRKTELAVKTDIKNAYLMFSEAQERLEVAQSSVEMAEESMALVQKQYEGGSVPITRYLEAELDLNRSRMSSTAAFYDREKAAANIRRAIGYWIDR